MRINESNFIKELRKSNQNALDYLMDQYGALIKSIVMKVLWIYRDEFMVDECISDILIAIWNNIDKYDETKGSFKNWICTIARYKAVDTYRKHKSSVDSEDIPDNLNPIMAAEDEYLIQNDKKVLLKLIDEMDEPDRTIFVMKFFLGESTKKIGETVNLTVGAVNTRISRGREKLKQAYKNQIGGRL